MQPHFAKLPQPGSFAALQRIVKYMGYGDYIKEQKLDASKLDILVALANHTPETGPFLARFQALGSWRRKEDRREGCPFALSTIHASKGLGYDRVLLIDVVDGLFPSLQEGGGPIPRGPGGPGRRAAALLCGCHPGQGAAGAADLSGEIWGAWGGGDELCPAALGRSGRAAGKADRTVPTLQTGGRSHSGADRGLREGLPARRGGGPQKIRPWSAAGPHREHRYHFLS